MADRNVTHLLKRSNVPGKIPTEAQLKLGEVALNTADAKMYTEYTGGATGATEVRAVGWDRLSTESGGTVNGEVFIDSNFSANTISIISTPQNNDSLTQVLVRDTSTGNIEYRNASSFTFVTGGTTTGATNDSELASIDLLYNDPVINGQYVIPFEDTFVTGGTYDKPTKVLTLDRNDGVSPSISLTQIANADELISAATFVNDTLILSSANPDITTPISAFTNVNIDNLTVESISGSTLTAFTINVDQIIIDGGSIGDSKFKADGEMYIVNNSTATVFGGAGIPTIISGTTIAGEQNDFFHDVSLNRLTYTGTTTQQFHITTTLTANGDGNALFLFQIYKNGIALNNLQIEQQFSSTRSGLALNGLTQLNPNDYLDLRAEISSTPLKDLFVVYMNMSVVQI